MVREARILRSAWSEEMGRGALLMETTTPNGKQYFIIEDILTPPPPAKENQTSIWWPYDDGYHTDNIYEAHREFDGLCEWLGA